MLSPEKIKYCNAFDKLKRGVPRSTSVLKAKLKLSTGKNWETEVS